MGCGGSKEKDVAPDATDDKKQTTEGSKTKDESPPPYEPPKAQSISDAPKPTPKPKPKPTPTPKPKKEKKKKAPEVVDPDALRDKFLAETEEIDADMRNEHQQWEQKQAMQAAEFAQSQPPQEQQRQYTPSPEPPPRQQQPQIVRARTPTPEPPPEPEIDLAKLLPPTQLQFDNNKFRQQQQKKPVPKPEPVLAASPKHVGGDDDDRAPDDMDHAEIDLTNFDSDDEDLMADILADV